MLINGRWLVCDDEIVRPVVEAEVFADDGRWQKFPFLVDSGADRTVFSAQVLEQLKSQSLDVHDHLIGVGGASESVLLETAVRFTREEDNKVIFRGHFAAFPDVRAIDMSILGRDLLNYFALIVDRPADTVCLLG